MNSYKNIPNFQKMLNGQRLHYLMFRALKIKTGENSYEYIITNLPFSFDIDDIKDIYHWRRGIETTFRYLKHANDGLLHFHCKKTEILKQEIYTNLVLYNFGIFLANEVVEENNRKKNEILIINIPTPSIYQLHSNWPGNTLLEALPAKELISSN